ncbi:hypothetical protein SAMN05216371_1672 [Streptomyces sp. TLI_053]|nr:hypothetical protein SAMN05216371_1672 [Streptomyces sp. TLI_053]
MRKRLLPPGGLRGMTRSTGRRLYEAGQATGTWLGSPRGRTTVRVAVELLKLCARFKGIDTDSHGGDPLER